MGYDTIDALLLGNIAVDIILVLVVVKAIIWSISLGSGTSGGVLAPLLIMGGSLGALEGHLFPFGTIPLWVLVSMGAMIGGTMRSPFTGVVFSLELTHDVNALLPLLVGAICAEAVTVFSMKRSILTEKVARRGVHVAREYSVDILELTPVSSVLHRNFHQFAANTPLEQIVKQYNSDKEAHFGYPIVDALGAIQGYVSQKQVASLLRDGVDQKKPIRDFLHSSYSIVFSDEPLRVAADRLALGNSESLPVVDQSNPQKVVGIVSQEDLFAARVLWFADEKNREKVLSVPSYSTTKEMILKGLGKIRKRKKVSDEERVDDTKVSNDQGDSF